MVRASGDPTVVVYCHCRDCRRSSGAPVSLFAGYRSGRIELTRGEPKVYESSPGVYRSFCGQCGAPVSFEDERLPGETYLPVGVFDCPEAFEPEKHDWVSRRLRWFDVPDGLPRHEERSILQVTGEPGAVERVPAPGGTGRLPGRCRWRVLGLRDLRSPRAAASARLRPADGRGTQRGALCGHRRGGGARLLAGSGPSGGNSPSYSVCHSN